jgi:hypothetical protein
MEQMFIAHPFPRDWHNYHYDSRTSWLASPWPEPERRTLFMRIQSMLARLSGRIASPAPDPGKKRDS